MRGLEGEQVLLRIIVSESQEHEGAPLHRRILDLLRREGLAGATVLKGVAGFGHGRAVHTVAIETAAHDLPVVLETVESEARIEAVLAKLEPMMTGGLATVERARVIRYSHAPRPG